MKKYRTKVDIITLSPFFIFTMLFVSSTKNKLLAISMMSLLIILFFGHVILSTYYIISSKKLRIKSSIFYDKTIDIMTIKKVSEISDIFSSPAASMKKLLIKFNDNESVAISPVDKLNFIKDLKEINQTIQVDLKE